MTILKNKQYKIQQPSNTPPYLNQQQTIISKINIQMVDREYETNQICECLHIIFKNLIYLVVTDVHPVTPIRGDPRGGGVPEGEGFRRGSREGRACRRSVLLFNFYLCKIAVIRAIQTC